MDSGSVAHPSATDVVISSADATTATTTVAAAGVNPAILSNAAASLNLGLGTSNKKKSATNRRSDANKIECVHESLDKMQRGVDLLESMTNFLNETATAENKATNTLLIDAINLSTSIFKGQIGSISNSVNNTREKRSSIQAHTKLTKNSKQEANHAKLEEKRAMKNNPTSALKNANKAAKNYTSKVITSLGKRKADESSAVLDPAPASLPPRQVRKASDGDKSQDTIDAAPQPRVPRPSDGALIYHPS